MADPKSAGTETPDKAPATEAGSQDDLGAIWMEMDREDSGNAADAAPPEQGREEHGETGAAAQPSLNDEPTAATAGQTAPAPTEGADAKPQSDRKPSIWDTAPPELRAEFERLSQDVRARGKDIAELRQVLGNRNREIEALRRAAPTTGAAKPGEQKTTAGIIDRDALKALRDEYPEIGERLEAQFDALETAVKAHDAKLAAVDEHAAREAETAAMNAVEARHPGYISFIGEHGQAFEAWRQTQPRHVREAIDRNWDRMTDPDEVIDIVDRFKSHLGGPGKEPPAQAGTPNPLADRRRRQLAATAGPKSSSQPSTVVGIPEDGDPKAIWAAFEAMERQQGAGRR